MVDLDELDRLHAALKSGQIEAVIVGQAREVVTILRAYPALAAEVRALRAKLAERAEEVRLLREAARAGEEAVKSAAHAIDDYHADAFAVALAKVPR